MADRPLKLKQLRKIVRRYDVVEDSSIGKGSHTTFLRKVAGGIFSYPIPTHGSDMVLVCYVKGLRKRLRLTPNDGVSDRDFYSG